MKRVICIILLIVFLAVFCVSGYKLINYYKVSHDSKAVYNDLADIKKQAQQEEATAPSAATPANPDDPTAPTTDPRVELVHPETGKTVLVLPEYVALWKRNPDLVGWIEIPGTNINYPVVQSRTENYYLYNNFDEEVDYHGTIYVREVCDVFKPSDNLTIYGHHLIDGTMFHELDEFKKESFWREHKTFTFDTVSEHHTYEIVSVFLTTATLGEGFTYHEFVDAADAAEFDAYVAKCKELALFDTGVTATYGDKLITLSTCDHDLENGRLVVVAKRMTE